MKSPYPARRRRAIELLGTRAEAEEILLFLIVLMDGQAPWFERALSLRPAPGHREAPAAAADADLPWDDLAPGFRRFVVEVSRGATEVLRDAGAQLEGHGTNALAAFLEGWVRGSGGLPEPHAFFARAFLQPFAEAFAAGRAARDRDWGRGACPACGRPPLMSVVRDEPDRLGGRYLLCGFCATDWAFPRAACPLCDERDPDVLFHHTADTLPHLRVDECRSCGVYLKGVDLRVDGKAVPLVDEAAAVELDLWAGQQGLKKGQANVLGL